jgi:enamine deaminase RidA (YjgF/YER057c/UK114 family)
MILSKRHKFIFIKGVKVAGTSIEIALTPFCGPSDIITPITPIDELMRLAGGTAAQNYLEDRVAELAYLAALQQSVPADLGKLQPPASEYSSHMGLRDVLRLQGAVALGYQVVCAERNPYAKIISWANHQLSFSAYQTGAAMRAAQQDVRVLLKEAIEDRRILAVKNIDRYRDAQGLILARVIRYEHLEDDFRSFMTSLGNRYQARLPHVKKGLLSNLVDPREFFNDLEIDTINELFCDEFETFNYVPL